MKILITYFSQTGNTKKVAESIFTACASQAHESSLLDLKQVTADDLDNLDLLFIGSTCHSADLAKPVIDFLDSIHTGMDVKLAGFVTHATKMPEGSELDRQMHERWAGKCESTFQAACLEKGLSFLGYFHCQGAPNPPIADFIHQEIIPDQAEFDEYLQDVQHHPDETDLQNAKTFANRVTGKAE